MIRGIGIDTVTISEIERYLSEAALSNAFIRCTFTAHEITAAERYPNKAEYYAARFATKEAVFKAVGHLTKEKTFDFRIVETLHAPDGSPYVSTKGTLSTILKAADVDKLHLSITTEGDYATAFVVAEKQ